MKSNPILKIILAVLVVIAAVLIFRNSGLRIENGTSALNDGPQTGAVLDDFELISLDGESVKLSDYRGKKVIINFWATWCNYCQNEMPLLDEYYQKYSSDLVVLAVDYHESQEIVKQYVEETQYQFPILLDEDGAVARKYLVPGLPVSFFLDDQGVLVDVQYGELNRIILDRNLKTLGVIQ